MMDFDFHLNYTGYADPNKDKSDLKFPSGRYRLNLFHEFNQKAHEDYPPLYTMREEPFRGLPSAYLIYMTSTSEYEAAMKLMGSWQHWKRYYNSKQFMEGPEVKGGWEGLQSWREEKEIRDAQEAYQQLKTSAAMGSVPAQKAIWDDKTKARKGRPSKDAIRKAAAEAAQAKDEIKADLKRIGKLVEIKNVNKG